MAWVIADQRSGEIINCIVPVKTFNARELTASLTSCLALVARPIRHRTADTNRSKKDWWPTQRALRQSKDTVDFVVGAQTVHLHPFKWTVDSLLAGPPDALLHNRLTNYLVHSYWSRKMSIQYLLFATAALWGICEIRYIGVTIEVVEAQKYSKL